MFKTPLRPTRPLSRPTTPSTPRSGSAGPSNSSYTGSISVSVRIKPSPSTVTAANAPAIFHTPTTVTVPDLGTFSFDNVFGPLTTNAEVYNSLMGDMVSRVVEGFNATVFAYGMTGSGKTHSMSGGAGEKGVVPLAVSELFAKLSGGEQLSVSYLEIYNEKIHDLLGGGEDLKLREMDGVISVLGIAEKTVSNEEELLCWIRQGDENRRTSSTEYNLKSSRSHAIIQIKLTSKTEHQTLLHSTLSLCDLAGSERATSSTDRRKEGAYINKSLLSLTNVIVKLSTRSSVPVSRSTSRSESRASSGRETPKRRLSTPMRPPSSMAFGRSTSSLSNRDQPPTPSSSNSVNHIPYRDSKLTRLLQNSLSGEALVAILCTVSSANSVLVETTNTLRFAQRAKNVKVSVKRNESTDNDKDKIIAELRKELALKDTLLADKRTNGSSPNPGILINGSSDDLLSDELIQLRSENKILLESQTHLTRLLESRNYSSTILKNDIISQIVGGELSQEEMILKLEELFKAKFIEVEEQRSYTTYLESQLRLEMERTMKQENSSHSTPGSIKNGASNDRIERLEAQVSLQCEEISQLKDELEQKKRLISVLKTTSDSKDNLMNAIGRSQNRADLSGVMEVDEEFS